MPVRRREATRQRALRIAGRHVARQAVGRVVGDADRLLFVVVGQDRTAPGRRSPRARSSCRSARWRRPSAARSSRARGPRGRPGPPVDELGALVDALLDQPLDLVRTAPRSPRARCVVPLGRADRRPTCASAASLAIADRLGEPRARHEHARRRVARLAAVVEAGAHAAASRVRESPRRPG